MIRPNGAVIVLGLVCALAVVEIIAAFLEYRPRLRDADWQEMQALIEQRDPEGALPVIVAGDWLGPLARMHLPGARSWDAVAYPDLRSFERFWLLAHNRERPWRGRLRDELEAAPRPELVGIHKFGEIELLEYRQVVAPQVFALLDSIDAVSTERGRCNDSGSAWSCKDGRVAIRTVEVDYRPRRCVTVELDDGVMAKLELGKLELGDRIHGHVGFADFNARLRSDPSARVELWIDDRVAGRWVFTDDQGWASFALATPPGRHTLELRVGTTVAGTWQRQGHTNSPTDVLCVELRGFLSQEGDP